MVLHIFCSALIGLPGAAFLIHVLTLSAPQVSEKETSTKQDNGGWFWNGIAGIDGLGGYWVDNFKKLGTRGPGPKPIETN